MMGPDEKSHREERWSSPHHMEFRLWGLNLEIQKRCEAITGLDRDQPACVSCVMVGLGGSLSVLWMLHHQVTFCVETSHTHTHIHTKPNQNKTREGSPETGKPSSLSTAPFCFLHKLLYWSSLCTFPPSPLPQSLPYFGLSVVHDTARGGSRRAEKHTLDYIFKLQRKGKGEYVAMCGMMDLPRVMNKQVQTLAPE